MYIATEYRYTGVRPIRIHTGNTAAALVEVHAEFTEGNTAAWADVASLIHELEYRDWVGQLLDLGEFAYHLTNAKSFRGPGRCKSLSLNAFWDAWYDRNSFVVIRVTTDRKFVGLEYKRSGFSINRQEPPTNGAYKSPWLYFSGPVQVVAKDKDISWRDWAWVRIITPSEKPEGKRELLAKDLISYAQSCAAQGAELHLSLIEAKVCGEGGEKITNPKRGVITYLYPDHKELIVRIHL